MTGFVTIAASLLLGLLAPWLLMKALARTLAEGRRVENYRGRPVFLGLGIVWVLWAGAALVIGLSATASGDAQLLPLLTLAGPLALAAFVFGLIDDALGTGADRGFRGHIKAALRGRLTTGGLKVLGVSAASYAAALVVVEAAGWAVGGAWTSALMALPAGAAIALTANFVNLTDLRPGRALKVYSVLVTVGAVLLVLGARQLWADDIARAVSEIVALVILLAAPVVAVWKYDAGELGMLGDSGANPAGAVAGLVFVLALPFWAVLVYLAAVFALNLASEKVSFSRAIESNRFLHRLDMLGRRP